MNSGMSLLFVGLSTNKVEALQKAVIKNVNEVPIVLENIAEVRIGAKAPKLGLASDHGKEAVLMTITRQPATSTLELTDQLDRSLAELQKTLPKDVKVTTDIFRQSRFINSSIDNVQKSLYEGGIFVVIVLFLFLMNIRTTVISLITIPLSVIVALVTLKIMGLTINTMSLGGIAIAIGSLVDDAIVDVENVFKRLRENRQKPEKERKSVITVVVRSFERSTYADPEFHIDYRGEFCAVVFSFRYGRQNAGSAGDHIRYFIVCFYFCRSYPDSRSLHLFVGEFQKQNGTGTLFGAEIEKGV